MKCLQAGFQQAVFIVARSGARKALQKAISARVEDAHQERVLVLLADELPAYFDDLAEEVTSESVVRGYRVKVNPRVAPDATEHQRRIAEVIARSLKRLKE